MADEAAVFEGWRPVVGFEDVYEVSDAGRVRRGGHVLIPLRNSAGYRAVQLWRDGRPTTRLIHVLVAAAFLGPAPEGQDVNHCDGDKTHNAVANLEYVTRSENNRHAYRLGLRKVTVDQMSRARRKPRATVACACGCGRPIETPDAKGRARKFVTGHNMRNP